MIMKRIVRVSLGLGFGAGAGGLRRGPHSLCILRRRTAYRKIPEDDPQVTP
jgi:hypothetical protein